MNTLEWINKTRAAKLRMDMQEADDAFHAELVRQFGKDAGDARYQKRGVSTPELKHLADEYVRISEEWREAFRQANA